MKSIDPVGAKMQNKLKLVLNFATTSSKADEFDCKMNNKHMRY